ncbi:hypothetical protein ACFODW_13515 [Virgibacillus sediminis]|uniref:Uncharacterized protein n=1 Tax=Virgibacillus sediminis TaxID=202260 RepID=A0ABV7A903_9BACI
MDNGSSGVIMDELNVVGKRSSYEELAVSLEGEDGRSGSGPDKV